MDKIFVMSRLRCRLSFSVLMFLLATAWVGPVCPASQPMDSTRVLSPQNVRSGVNDGGPENWPETSGISTEVSSPAANPASTEAGAQSGESVRPSIEPAEMKAPGVPPPVQNIVRPSGRGSPAPASQPERVAAPPVKDVGTSTDGAVTKDTLGVPLPGDKSAAGKEVEKPREVIYVDDKGNPIPKPPEPDKMLKEAKALIDAQKLNEALAELGRIRVIPDLDPAMLEEVLYLISDCLWNKYLDNPLAGYEAIISSTNEAMNANLRSNRVPGALLRLSLANANVGNLEDAGGYAVALGRRYPDYPGVGQAFTALGLEQFKQKKFAQAEQSFSLVLDKYPESSFLESASLGLARTLFAQSKHEQADLILDFISKRWSRGYLSDPDIVLLHAQNTEKLGKIAPALEHYWLYFNLNPERKDSDKLMLHMADMYFREGNTVAAFFLYREIGRRFGKSYIAAVARQRLAEKGIYDAPITYQRMGQVFAGEGDVPLKQAYSALARLSKTEAPSVLARLKLAFWLYWDKDYSEAMGRAADFIDAYPENAGVPEARNIIWQAFQKELANSLSEQNYDRILTLWNGFPLVRERYGPLDPRLRFALAQGWIRRGDDQKALTLLTEFLKSPMDPQYGEAAFMEFFDRYLKAGNWNGILDLGNLVAGWQMSPQLRNQLDYALALSAQNLNLAGPALTMWKQLAGRTDIPLYQRAYATFFLARDAERRKDIRDAYARNREAIDLFGQLQDERSDKADPQRIKDAISALMDICEVDNRVPEALDWLARYNAYVPEDSPEYPGLRFREARLYRKLGDSTRAKALLEDIVRRAPDSPFGKAAQSELHTFDVSRDLQEYMPGGDRSSKQQ